MEADHAADAAHGSDADRPEAQHLKTGQGTQDLAISAQGTEGGPVEPGLGVRISIHGKPANGPGRCPEME